MTPDMTIATLKWKPANLINRNVNLFRRARHTTFPTCMLPVTNLHGAAANVHGARHTGECRYPVNHYRFRIPLGHSALLIAKIR